MLGINERLKKVGSYVEGKRLADIGSDHAYLPIYLINENKIEFAIAGEVVEGPHNISKNNVKLYGLDSKVDCRLGSGLRVIGIEDNIDNITICGMGGKLISDILLESKEKLINKPRLVLQPNMASHLVRETLLDLNYKIITEDILEEDNHIYEIIVAEYGVDNLNSLEIQYGKFLPKENSEVFRKKITQELNKVEYILTQMEKSSVKNEEKIKELEKEKCVLENILNSK